jgi:hypothetical protein
LRKFVSRESHLEINIELRKKPLKMTRRAPTPPTEARTSPEITEAASAIMPSITETATTMEPTSAQHEDISQQHEIANPLHGANPLALAAIKNFYSPLQ